MVPNPGTAPRIDRSNWPALRISPASAARGIYGGLRAVLTFSTDILCMVRRAWLEEDKAAKRWVVLIAATWAILMPPIMWLTPRHADLPITPLSFCFAYWLALGVFCVAGWFKFPKGKAFTALGVVSYSLYLFHPLCIDLMVNLVPPTGIWQNVAFACAALAGSIVVATISYYLVERPSLRFGHRLMKLVQAPSGGRMLKAASN